MAKDKPESMFREQALAQLDSPEQLDELLQVVGRRSWIPVVTAALGLALILVWSVFGQIPVNVAGVGILVYPRQVVSFQAPAAGQLVGLEVHAGERVTKGALIARINQPELAQALLQERVRLAQVRSRNQQVVALHSRSLELQREALGRKRKLLEARIASTERMARSRKTKNDRYIVEQGQKLAQLRGVSQSLDQALQQRLESYKALRAEGLSSDEPLLKARQSYIDNQVRAAELELRAQEVELKQLESENEYLRSMDLVAELRFRLEELAIEASQIDQRELEKTADSELEVHDIVRNIALLEEELRTKGSVRSEYTGRVLEVTAALGQFVAAGQRLGAIEAEDPGGELVAIAYFPVADGKRIVPGMDMRITPATVSRERHGSLLGTVTEVSRFPVTTEAVTNMVGNAEVARELTGAGGKIEVFTRLVRAPGTPTGYAWSSGGGPDVSITAGTTLSVRATVEYRRPITFVIPILRYWSGMG